MKEESHTLHIQKLLLISFHILCFPFLLSGSCLGLKTRMILNASPSLRPYNSSAKPIDSVIKISPAFNYFCLRPLRPPWFKPPPPYAWTLEMVSNYSPHAIHSALWLRSQWMFSGKSSQAPLWDPTMTSHTQDKVRSPHHDLKAPYTLWSLVVSLTFFTTTILFPHCAPGALTFLLFHYEAQRGCNPGPLYVFFHLPATFHPASSMTASFIS